MNRPRAFLATAIALLLVAFAPASASAAAPTILTTPVSGASTTEITLEAEINPQGKATKYHFAYGPADCSSNPCATTHVSELKSGTTPVTASARIEGLEPGTTYHFQAFAENKEGDAQSPDRSFMTFLAPQQFGPCPNDALRLHNPAASRIEYSAANLPDCRAYEQASPVNKGGGDVSATPSYIRVASDGGAVSFLSLSGTPGGLGSQEFPLFLAARSGEGWSSDGLLPPAGFGQQAKVIGWSPDFSQVYTQATVLGPSPLSQAFLVASPGGFPQTIVPYTPNLKPDFAGASEGGAEVLFESKATIAGVAGAQAGKPNLYLWDRASDTLHLAGVMNDQTAPAKGAFAGSYDWVGGATPQFLSEGGAIQRYYLEDQHAISADGAAVYFTAAGTGQLYARLNPTQPQSATDGQGKCTQPALACTVNLSASKRTIPDPAGNRPAAFMGASADGTKSLFTSTQMLTDDANTGPEQEAAAIARSDLEGENVNPDLVPTHASGVAVDSEHVYWVDLDTGAIARAMLDGTQVDHEFITETEDPKGLAVAGGYIYWTNGACDPEKCEEEGKGEDGTIGRAKLNGEGAASEVKQDFIEGARNPWAVVANAEHLYWTSSALRNDGKSFIGRSNLNGEEADNEILEGAGQGERLPGIALDSSHIYWMNTSPLDLSSIGRADLDGANYVPTLIFVARGGADREPHGRGIAVQGNHLYWAAEGTSWIGRAQLNGDEPASKVELEFITGAAHPQGLAADATNLYWSANGESTPNPGNDLYQYDTTKPAGERLSDLAPDHGDPDGAEVRGVLGTSADGSYVYFAANGVPDEAVGSPNAGGESAAPGNCPAVYVNSTPGTCNLYLAHAGTIEFIARLSVPGDRLDWAPSPTVFASENPRTAWVTPDGRTLLFASHRQLTSYPNEGAAELYRYRADTAQLHCVSCNPTGERPSFFGGSFFGSITTSAVTPPPPASTLSHSLSTDGNRVFFETTDALVGEDTNGQSGCPAVGSINQQITMRACADTYEWEAQGSGSCEAAEAVADDGCIYLISTGKGTEPQLLADASADGSEVLFFTRSRLVGQDEDSLMDVYGARVNGGLGAQNQPPSPPRCEAEGCKPQASAPPQVQSPAAISGPENPPIKRPRCKKPKHLVKGRCQGAKHHKAAKEDKRGRGRAHARGSAK